MTNRFLPSEYLADPKRAAATVAARLAGDPCSEPIGSLKWTEHVGAILDDTNWTQPEPEIIDGVEVNHPEHDRWRTDFWIEVERLTDESDDDIVCECEGSCTTYKGCPCQQIDCEDDECGNVRGCLDECACLGGCD